MDGQNSAAYYDRLNKILQENNIDIFKCRGQGYDGASVMSGAYIGLQAKISQRVKNAFYAHYAAHNLNFVIFDAANSSAIMKTFFETIHKVFNYFTSSGIRWKNIGFINKEGNPKTLKTLCPTRWESHHDSIHTLLFKYEFVLKELTNISLISTETEERN